MPSLREAATQALEALEGGADSWQLVGPAIDALRAALAEPVLEQDIEDAIEAAYWHFDARRSGLNEWASAPQSERDAFKAEARKLVRGYFPTRQAQDTKREMRAVADAFIRGKRAALAQEQAEPDSPERRCGGPGCDLKCCQPVQEPGVWTPVTDALPQSGVKVLACYRNRLGNLRRIRAMWTAAKTEEASSEDAEACSEYDEATDTYYVTEGWYECIDNWGDYSSVAVTEGEVTHWMPLPPDPDSTPPQRKPLTEEEILKAVGWDRAEMYMKLTPNFPVAEAKRETLKNARAIERAHGIGDNT